MQAAPDSQFMRDNQQPEQVVVHPRDERQGL